MIERFDRIVVGGGAMGLATAWQLAMRGVRVVLLERFEPGHTRGASHGATRNMNNAYAEDHYLDLYDEALGLYRELERGARRSLLSLTGLVTHGAEARVSRAHEALRSRGASTRMLTAALAADRWPGLRFTTDVLLNRDAGRIDAAGTLEALAGLARAAGAELRYGHRVVALERDRDEVTVDADPPERGRVRFAAERAVVTAGAWTTRLVGDLVGLPPLTVTEEHPAHFAMRPGFVSGRWPSFNHFLGEDGAAGNRGSVYGMLTPGEGVKVGFHGTGDVVDPDARPFRATDEARERLREHVAEWFPGLDPDSAVEVSCTYTSTSSERFVLDQRGPLSVGAGFSGQGFKFVPAVGRILADATMGVSAPPEAFRLGSHLGV